MAEACKSGGLDIVKYFLQTPGVKELIDIHANSDACLINAHACGHHDILHFLVHDYGISLTDNVQQHIVNNHDATKDLQAIFQSKELDNNLPSNAKGKIQRVKI